MDWKREAMDKLRNYEAKKNSIPRAEEEIQRLESELVRIKSTSADDLHVSGGCDREDAVVNNIATREELKLAIADASHWVDIVDSGLSELDDEERRVLDLFYINPAKGNVGRLRQEFDLNDDSSVYRRKDKALRHFTLALYGVIET